MTSVAVNIGFLEAQTVSQRSREERFLLTRKHIASALFLFAALVVQVWVRLLFIESGYRLEELRNTALKNDALVRDERVEYALMIQPEHLSRSAEERLGMKKITPQQVRKIN